MQLVITRFLQLLFFPQHACSQKPLACIFPTLQKKKPHIFSRETMFLRLSKSGKQCLEYKTHPNFQLVKKCEKNCVLNSQQYGLRFLVHAC